MTYIIVDSLIQTAERKLTSAKKQVLTEEVRLEMLNQVAEDIRAKRITTEQHLKDGLSEVAKANGSNTVNCIICGRIETWFNMEKGKCRFCEEAGR